MVGDVVTIKKADKTYTIEGADVEEDEAEAIKANASKVDQSEIDYEELANFRDESDIIAILQEADPSKIDKSVLPQPEKADESSEPVDGDPGISDDDLPF